jgi:uridine phosphorylase
MHHDKKMSEADLILNDRGAIYHLGLCPGEIADTVITVGDPERVPLVSRYFDSIEFTMQHREMVTHTGYLGRKRLTVMSTGMGTGAIDIVLNELDALVNVNFQTRRVKEPLTSLNIIRLGTTGGLQAEIPLDSIILSSYAMGLDSLMHYYQYQPLPEEIILQKAVTDHLKELSEGFYVFSGSQLLLRKFTSQETLSGITATCPGFYGSQGRILRAPLQHPQLLQQLTTFNHDGLRVTNLEMETVGIYGLGALLGHHTCSLSSVIVNRATKVFSNRMQQGVLDLIEYALARLAE